jgi:hypothetical protein
MAAELTLEAALRDSQSANPEYRNQAVRNLAAALLMEMGRPSPAWKAAHDHHRGPEVLGRLREALSDEEEAPIRGLALVGLAQLGEAELLDYAELWIDAPDPDPDADDAPGAEQAGQRGANAFLRECAVIALGLLGDAAAKPDNDEGWSVASRCRQHLTRVLTSPHDDVRFQACISLAELGGRSAEEAIVQAARAEEVDAVRANQVAALSVFDPPSPDACELLRSYLQHLPDPRKAKRGDPQLATSYNAALALAAARDRGALPRLVLSLENSEERDRALEAIAALGPPLDESALRVIRNMATSRLSPGLTRVRAAYAMSRVAPEEGQSILARLERSWRPAVRNAVAEARVALDLLARRERETDS